ncbi:MAG: LPS-assembly protein LptD, partial [Bdellovibrionales bacterium]|nr:LPS-assembly protein LptD [Bdellovibrionales bacterium]
MKRNEKEKTITLRGNVRAVIRGHSLTCDQAVIYFDENKVVARGNIVLITDDAYMEGDEIVLNYGDNTGIIRNGLVRSGDVTIEGEMVSKTSEKNYEIVNGYYTPCKTCPPAWSLSGSKVDAEMGGFAYIKNSVLRIADFPVFWLPYMVVPLMNKRQTGFLFPRFDFSGKSGFTVSEDFFWAMSENTDSTWTFKNYERRGPKGLLNYRYLLTESSGGELDLSYMKDRYAATEERNIYKSRAQDEGPLSRYMYKYKHHFELPEGYIHDVDINVVSDTLYPKDFPEEMAGHGTPALENRMSLTKNTDTQHTSVDVTVFQSLMEDNAIHDNTNAVHRFPEIQHTIVPQRLGSTFIFPDLDVTYSNFSRKGSSFDDASNKEGDEYTEGEDTIRTGQRFIVRPRISTPFDIAKKFELTPSVAFQESLYQFDVGDNPSTERQFVKTEVDLRTRFSAIFGDDNLEGTRYRHEVQPVIRYTTVPWVYEDRHTFFESDDEIKFYQQSQPIIDGDPIQFDYDDRLINRNIITFELINNIIRREWNGRSGEYNRIVQFK